jgi:hypothetical protein
MRLHLHLYFTMKKNLRAPHLSGNHEGFPQSETVGWQPSPSYLKTLKIDSVPLEWDNKINSQVILLL